MSASANLIEASRIEFERALQRNIKGIGYFNSPAPVVGASKKDVLIDRGTLKLYHYRPLVDDVYRVPVVLVMATTNRGYIFDMAPGQSMVEYLLQRGYDVFMIDWDAPKPGERSLSLSSYVLDFLPASFARVQAETGEPDFSVLAYCMGGVLSLLWAALHPDGGLKNLVTFTTPVDFRHLTTFQSWSDQRFFDVDRLVDTLGNCPGNMTYQAFSTIRPAGQLAANIRLYDRLWDDEFVKAHRMIDRWSSDVLPLAGEYFRETVKKLLWGNALMEGTMEVGGRPVDLSRITVPFLHATALHDDIVPTEASAPLIDMIGSTDKQQITLKGGHVSLIGGPNAVRRLWPSVDEWLGEKSL